MIEGCDDLIVGGATVVAASAAATLLALLPAHVGGQLLVTMVTLEGDICLMELPPELQVYHRPNLRLYLLFLLLFHLQLSDLLLSKQLCLLRL